MQFFVFQKWIEAFFSNVCGTLILCFLWIYNEYRTEGVIKKCWLLLFFVPIFVPPK